MPNGIVQQDAAAVERAAWDLDRVIKYATESATRRERTIIVWRMGIGLGASVHEPDGAKILGRAVWREECQCARWESAF